MILAKLSSKGQVTVPKEIRVKLHLRVGDMLSYELDGDIVKVRKVAPFDAVWTQAVSGTLEEWQSPENDEAFVDL